MDNSGWVRFDLVQGLVPVRRVYKYYFPGGGFSTGYISPGGIECQAGRLPTPTSPACSP